MSKTLTRYHSPEITPLGEPCRGFNFLTVITLMDARDGKEKMVLSNWVGANERGSLLFIDVQTRELEVLPLPADKGAWALLPVGNDRLIVGTCSSGGYLSSLDLKTRQWTKPIRDERITYIFSLAMGSDGMIYGGVYPTGSLIRCDPDCTKMEDLGRPFFNAGNLYCRDVYGDIPGYILVTGGFARTYLAAYHIETGKWLTLAESDGKDYYNIQEITPDRIYVERAGEILRFDTRTFQLVGEAADDPWSAADGRLETMAFRMAVTPKTTVTLRDGREAGVRGQKFFIDELRSKKREFHLLPVEPPVTSIRSMELDGKGNLWGSCSFGQTIFRYSLTDGTSWNSLGVTERMGEVYGMVFADGLLYMSCYAGGDHVVYDPAKPWEDEGKSNPQTLRSLYPSLKRPRACSILGPDGGVWTGWAAKYGVYGGGLTRIDRSSREVTDWLDPIPGQQVMGISADAQYVYFSTNSGGEGLPVRDEPGWFCIWHPVDGLTAKYPLASGDAVGKLRAVGGFVLVVEGEGLQRFDAKAKTFTGKIELGAGTCNLLDLGNSKVAAICGSSIKIVNYVEGVVEANIDLPTTATDAVVLPDGDIIFASGTGLFRLNFKANTPESRQ